MFEKNWIIDKKWILTKILIFDRKARSLDTILILTKKLRLWQKFRTDRNRCKITK